MTTAATQIKADISHPTLLARFFLIAFGLCWLITIPFALQVQGFTTLQLLPAPVQWLIGFAPLLAAAWVTRGSDQRRLWLVSALRLRVSAGWYAFAVALPWRIVTLLPSLAETVCALGACDRLVGVDDYANWPPQVRQLFGGLDPLGHARCRGADEQRLRDADPSDPRRAPRSQGH